MLKTIVGKRPRAAGAAAADARKRGIAAREPRRGQPPWAALARHLAVCALATGAGAAGAQPAGAMSAPPAGGAAATAPAAGARAEVRYPVEGLGRLIAGSLAQDPQVRVADALLRATDQRRLQARSRLAPTLSVTAMHGESQDLELVRVNRSTERAEASLKWNLYNGGNDGAELDAAGLDLAAAEEDLRNAREETALRIAEAYAELVRTHLLIRRSNDRLSGVSQLAAQVMQQVAAGKASDADGQQARASLLDAQMAHDQLLADETAARQRLATMVGREIRPQVPMIVQPSAVAPRGLSGRMAALRLRAAAARARVRPVASLAAPRVDLEYTRSLADRTEPALSTQRQSGWMVTARWDFALGGESFARRSEVELRAEAAEAEADRVRREGEAELAQLGPRIASARESQERLDQQIAQYDSLLRAGEIQFEAGRRSLAQLVQLHDSRYLAEQRRAEQSHRMVLSQLRQQLLTGGLLDSLDLPAGR